MSDTHAKLNIQAALSALLAAAICMAIAQVIGFIINPDNVGQNLLFGLALSFIAFGGTYAGAFFVPLVRHGRGTAAASGAAPHAPINSPVDPKAQPAL